MDTPPEGRIVKGNPADEIAKLKKQPGKDMLISGSISIGQAFSKQLELIDGHSLDRGAVSLLYRQRA